MYRCKPYREEKRLSRLGRCFSLCAVFFLFAFGAVLGRQTYQTNYDAGIRPLGTLTHAFSPAVLFASGRGMKRLSEPMPLALASFLLHETHAFDPALLPEELSGSHLLGSDSDSFGLTHWALFYALGWCWRLFGINHGAPAFLCAFMAGWVAVALYGLFRLGMGRLAAFLGALLTITTPPFLFAMPLVRDFGKAPFLLGFIALAGWLLSRRHRPWSLVKWAGCAGLLAGVGLGFRQDMLICVPVAIVVMAVAPMTGGYRVKARLAALAVFIGVFIPCAAPVLRGMRMDEGSVSSHTLFQGLSRSAEETMGFGEASYELLQTPSDTETHAVVNVHARLRGIDEAMDLYLSPAYGRAGRRLFLEWACAFPADMFARGLASIEAAARLGALTAGHPEYKRLSQEGWYRRFQPLHDGYLRYIEPFGLLLMAAALGCISMRDRRLALGALVLTAYFMAYPNLLFQVRHAFYLSFVIPWAALFLGDRLARLGILPCRAAGRQKIREAFRGRALWFHAARRTVGLFLMLALITTTLLVGLRAVQHRQVAHLVERYQNAALAPVETRVEIEGHEALITPTEILPGLAESWNLSLGDAAFEYLVLDIAAAEHPLVLSVAYQPGRGADFTRRLIVPPARQGASRTLLFVPVFELANFMPIEFALLKYRFANTPLANLLVHRYGTNAFAGIRLHEEDAPFLRAVYRVKKEAALPWLMYLRIPDSLDAFNYYKRTALEKKAYALPAELRYYLLGRDTHRIVAAYLDLLARFPGYGAYVERLRSLVDALEDTEFKMNALYQIGCLDPDGSGLVASELSRMGGDLRSATHLRLAERAYRLALRLAPEDRWHEVGLADTLFDQGMLEEARVHYTAVLAAAPESPYTAHKLDELLLRMNEPDLRLRAWEALHGAHPEAAAPAIRLARAIEDAGGNAQALSLYRQLVEEHPDNPEALLRLGILVCIEEGYAKGRDMMDKARAMDLGLQGAFVAGLSRIAGYYMSEGAYSFAEEIYREVIEYAPDDGWSQIYYAEALAAQGYYEGAVSALVHLLERAPESPYSAFKLDELFDHIGIPERRRDTWAALFARHPDSLLMGLRLGRAFVLLGEVQAALEHYRVVRDRHPDTAELDMHLGALRCRLESFEEGHAGMRAALTADPSLLHQYVQLSEDLAGYFLARQELDKAALFYRELVESEPDNPLRKVYLAEALMTGSRDEEAVQWLRSVLEVAPESPYAAKLMEEAFRRRGDDAGAIAVWTAVCNRNPDSVIPHLYLGRTHEAAGQRRAAYQVYRKMYERAPEPLSAFRYGALTAMLDTVETGRSIIMQTLSAAPEYQGEAARALADVAAWLEQQEQGEAAVELYSEAVTLAPEDLGYRLRLGELYMALELWEAGLNVLLEVVRQAPESPRAAEHIDAAYRALGDRDGAIALWRTLCQDCPEAAIPCYRLALALVEAEEYDGVLAPAVLALQRDPYFLEKAWKYIGSVLACDN